jgi:hypothetical protein
VYSYREGCLETLAHRSPTANLNPSSPGGSSRIPAELSLGLGGKIGFVETKGPVSLASLDRLKAATLPSGGCSSASLPPLLRP